MMTHESLESYYTNNFHVLFHRDIGFVNHFTYDDWNSMLPWEREINMMLMGQKMEAHKNTNSNG